MPSSVAHEILRMVVVRDPQSLFAHDALSHLEHFGNELIPGLVACLNDSDSEVRRVAIDLLAMTRPQSDRAVPLIIERLADEDRLVRLAAFWQLREEFGPMSVVVIPYLQTWLSCDDEYERILSLTSILTIDPSRTDLLPEIWNGTSSDHPGHREEARKFLINAGGFLSSDDAEDRDFDMQDFDDDDSESWRQ